MANSAVPYESSGQVYYDANVNTLAGHSAVVFVYPPNVIYNSNGESFESYSSAKNDKLVNVDVAFLKADKFRDQTQKSDWDDGDFASTNVGAMMYAVTQDEYFFKYDGVDASITKPSLQRGTINPSVAESIRIDAGGDGATFENTSLGMHTPHVDSPSQVEVDGLDEGHTPEPMLSYALRLEGIGVEDVAYRCWDQNSLSVNVNTTITGTDTITNQASHFDGIKGEYWETDGNGEASNRFFTSNSIWWTSLTKYVDTISAIEICNVERDEGDLRYGDVEDEMPFIYTGTHYAFSDAELTDVEAGNSLPIDDVEVWGGDCFIGLHTVKISNSTYSLTDPKKDIDGTGVKGEFAEQVDKWGWYFGTVIGGYEDVNRPISLKGAAQTITVLLESEINPEFAEKNQNNEYNYNYTSSVLGNFPVPFMGASGDIRAKFNYRYNLDYSPENRYKIFLPFKTYEKNVTQFDGRLGYSDQKIYLSDTEGFDRFRVLSIYDQDETYGAITGLVNIADRVYSIQQRAVSYVPIIADTIQTADGSEVSIRSGEIIGKPIYIDTLYGCQHPKTIKTDKDLFIFTDKRNGEVCFVQGDSLSLVSRAGMESFFTDMLASVTTDSDLSAVYDKKKKEYIVTHRDNESAVFNAISKMWTSRYPEDTSSNLLGGLRVEDKMYVIGIGSAVGVVSGSTHDVKFATLYEDGGTIGKWWNTTYSPQVSFYVNVEPDTIKTFDGYTILATYEPDPQTFDSYSDDGNIGRSVLTDSTLQHKEGSWRDKNMRVSLNSEDGGSFIADSSNRRARGAYGKMVINLNATNKSGMTSVLTKYRPSYRPI